MRSELLFLLFFYLSINSCKKDNSFDCLNRTGEEATESRVLANFNVIDVNHNLQLFLVQDTVNYAVIKGGKNLISSIETSIVDNTLIIKNNNNCNFTRSYKRQLIIYLHFKKMDELIYRGTGPITSVNTIVNESFTFNCWEGTDTVNLNLDAPLVYANIHTGVADLIVKGNTNQLFAYARSSGTFRMQQFICKNVYTNNISSRNHYFYVQNKLEALVQYVGNTYYKGNPAEVIKTENNQGKLIKF
jgi:hypothetical protein